MDAWINAKELADMLGKSIHAAQRIIKGRFYKKQPLVVRQEKITGSKGRPAYLVLWDTTTNQPATKEAEGDCHETVSDPTNQPHRRALVDSRANVVAPATQANAAPLPRSALADADINQAKTSSPAQAPNILVQAQAIPVLPGKELGIGGGDDDAVHALPLSALSAKPDTVALRSIAGGITGGSHGAPAQPGTSPKAQTEAVFQRQDLAVTAMTDPLVPAEQEDPPDFETLLFRKLEGKPKSTQRSLRAYYRKLYAESGEIPCALLADEGRQFSGRKSTLDTDIQNRFIDMVIKSADAADIFSYYTKDQRKVTVFHENLEKEFGRKIPINQLYSVVRSCNLKRFLDTPDDDNGEQKTPGFFKSEPVGALVQMDGVEADFFEIMVDGKWRKPIWIEFMDLGSRRLLAMHAYLSESSANSVDIFTRFLQGNDFAKQKMKIRPDNAGGFKNLRRPIKELNNRYAKPDGFVFIEDFARAGTPKDKAHLESSHRTAHKNLERSIINHFTDRIVGQYKKQKKVGNALRTVVVTQLNISLEDLNQSGMTEAYMRRHNGERHRFTEDGVQRSWVPDDRWQAHLTANAVFNFKPEDIELCKIYGYEKAKATISKEGTITYAKQKFYVDNTELWSRSGPTKIKVSLVDGHLAIFKDNDEGVYRGKAMPLQAPVKPEKVIEKEKAKVEKIHTDNIQHTIVTLLKKANMIINEERVQGFIAQGLTVEITCELLDKHYEDYAKRPNTIAPFHLFSSHAKKHLAEISKPKVLPYAEVG